MLTTRPSQSAAYVLPVSASRGRAFAEAAATHAYTVRGLWLKSLRDNTSVLAVNAALVLPTLTRIDQRLKTHLNDGTDVRAHEMLDIVVQSSRSSLVSYADRLARVAVQTAVASALLQLHRPYTDSMVYLWEVYPRMLQHYLGSVARVLRIPRFVVSLLGAMPRHDEVACMTATNTSLSVAAAFEDCVKRNAIVLAGDVVVDTLRIAADARASLRQRAVRALHTAVLRATAVLCSATGAAAGRGVAGDTGEFYGEVAGLMCAPVLCAHVAATSLRLQRQLRTARLRPRSSASHTRSHIATTASQRQQQQQQPMTMTTATTAPAITAATTASSSLAGSSTRSAHGTMHRRKLSQTTLGTATEHAPSHGSGASANTNVGASSHTTHATTSATATTSSAPRVVDVPARELSAA